MATFESKIVGLVSANCPDISRISHVVWFDINLLKDFQGDGLGSLMMSTFLDWAKNNGQIEKIGLVAHSTNKRAITMYKKLGFVEEGRRVKDIKYPEYYADSVIMGKLLNSR